MSTHIIWIIWIIWIEAAIDVSRTVPEGSSLVLHFAQNEALAGDATRHVLYEY